MPLLIARPEPGRDGHRERVPIEDLDQLVAYLRSKAEDGYAAVEITLACDELSGDGFDLAGLLLRSEESQMWSMYGAFHEDTGSEDPCLTG